MACVRACSCVRSCATMPTLCEAPLATTTANIYLLPPDPSRLAVRQAPSPGTQTSVLAPCRSSASRGIISYSQPLVRSIGGDQQVEEEQPSHGPAERTPASTSVIRASRSQVLLWQGARASALVTPARPWQEAGASSPRSKLLVTSSHALGSYG